MKVLHTSFQSPDFITPFRALPNNINDAIETLGHELSTYDDRKYLVPGRLRQAVSFFEHIDLKRINHGLCVKVKRERPDVCLISNGIRIFPSTAKFIRSLGVKTALWTTDPPAKFDGIIELAKDCDVVMCAGSEAIEILHKKGVTHAALLPFACDPIFHKKVDMSDEERAHYAHDVVFVGSQYPNREKVLELLANCGLAIWGPGWERLSNDLPLKNCIQGGALQTEEWTRLFSASKIVLEVIYQDAVVPCHQTSMRIFEALACESFVMTDNLADAPGIFTDKEHLVFFSGADDLCKKVKYYLEHEDERRAIARKGHELVVTQHTYIHRMQTLLKYCNGESRE
ncbi:MAG: glycosyltransferase [Candidatus Omnitrophica bacterium]|nr:glycosyltransferase [Candidatus Omnitrophota bacterium]